MSNSWQVRFDPPSGGSLSFSHHFRAAFPTADGRASLIPASNSFPSSKIPFRPLPRPCSPTPLPRPAHSFLETLRKNHHSSVSVKGFQGCRTKSCSRMSQDVHVEAMSAARAAVLAVPGHGGSLSRGPGSETGRARRQTARRSRIPRRGAARTRLCDIPDAPTETGCQEPPTPNLRLSHWYSFFWSFTDARRTCARSQVPLGGS